jgi:conjugal transfer pilus assembly protein TraB
MDKLEPKVHTNEDVRRKQLKIFILIFVSLGLGALICWYLGRESDAPLPSAQIRDSAPVYDVTRAVDDKSYWVFKSEKKLNEQEQAQNKMLKEIAEIREDLNKSPEQMAKAREAEEAVKTLSTRIEQLEEKLSDKYNYKGLPQQESMNNQADQLPNQENFGSENPSFAKSAPLPRAIFTEVLSLDTKIDETKNIPHIDSYIPAGSYAKAVLLSGVDVSAGVSSQSNPKPVLLRLVDKGSLPNKAIGNMKECRMIAAAFGDVSSERAYMRLEKLSCIEKNGNIIETDVDGYISGEDGKNGMRGRVVIRDGEVLRRGFMGGLLSGLGKAVNQSFATTTVSPLGSTSSINGKDIFKSAGAQGAGDAFELMARYNIQRAEQYQPVIQISAGRTVNVVFHSGSKFGERKTRKKEESAQGPKVGNIFGE